MRSVTKIVLSIALAALIGGVFTACNGKETPPDITPTTTPTVTPTSSPGPTAAPATSYLGSTACSQCHPSQYNKWRTSGHPNILRKSEALGFLPLPLPQGYASDSISYVVGGYKWKASYLDAKGFLITSPGGKPGKNQYSLATSTWLDYFPGETKDYDCGSCHTTGYSPLGHQDGLPGIKGTWALAGIQCETCHGPGEKHLAGGGQKSLIKVDTSARSCGQCHQRGEPDKIPAEAGFVADHAQYNELLASPHRVFECVTCHDPHQKAEASIVNDCSGCHKQAADSYYGSVMQGAGVACLDCHMPKAARSAASLGPNQGDVRTHLFRINTSSSAPVLTDDGKNFQPYIPLQYSCLQCHQGRDLQWAKDYAKDVHTLGKRRTGVVPPPPPEKPEATPTPTASPSPAQQTPSRIPPGHSTSGCSVCHEQGLAGAPRWPTNHAGRAEATCTTCHTKA